MPVTDTYHWSPYPMSNKIGAETPNDPEKIYKGRFRMWRRYVYRDAETGRFVSKDYAKANPSTTTRERIHV